MLVIEIAEPSPARERNVKHILPRGGIAFENCVSCLPSLIFHRVTADSYLGTKQAQPNGHGLHMGQIFDRFRILNRQLFARAHLFGHAPEGEWLKMKDKNNVRSYARHQIAHVVIESTPDR